MYFVSIDCEWNRDENGRCKLICVSCVFVNSKHIKSHVKDQTPAGKKIYTFKLYNPEWFPVLSPFWIDNPALKNCLFRNKGKLFASYDDRLDFVIREIKSLFETYRLLGGIKIIMGTTKDATSLLMVDDTIFNATSNGKCAYVDPIIVRSLFSKNSMAELDNPYSQYYEKHPDKKRLFNDLKRVLIVNTSSAVHNSDFDALINLCNYLAISNILE